MSVSFAIYLNDKHGRHVLLTDGAYIMVRAAQREQRAEDVKKYGFALHTPKLFHLKRDAITWAREHCNSRTDDRIWVERWDDPLPSDATPRLPVTIRLTPWMCDELSACEEGSYSDMQQLAREGRDLERPLDAHAHMVAKRGWPSGKIDIRTSAEADDMYYAVCSGVFKAKTPATYRAACRIADILRPFAKPETVREWPQPNREPFTGI